MQKIRDAITALVAAILTEKYGDIYTIDPVTSRSIVSPIYTEEFEIIEHLINNFTNDINGI